MHNRFLIYFFQIIIISTPTSAAIISSKSCSQGDVSVAIQASKDGDTVLIPPGTCTWTPGSKQSDAAITIDKKSIVLQGASNLQTIIRAPAGFTGYNQEQLCINSIQNKQFRITGLKFLGTGNPNTGLIKLSGTCKNWRIDSCYFDYTGTRHMQIYDHNAGVIDHCTFIMSDSSDGLGGIGITGDDDSSWIRPHILGDSDKIYIEDCNFIAGSHRFADAVDCYGGANVVFRHNKTGLFVGTHGLCQAAPRRGAHLFEIYENTFTTNIPDDFTALFMEGGTGVIFNNKFIGPWTSAIYLVDYRTCEGKGIDQCGDYGRCDGTNPIDGNTSGLKGYPCKDQIGRSSNQKLYPLYIWGNIIDKETELILIGEYTGCNNPSVADHIQKNRDYYEDTLKTYTPYRYPHPLTIAHQGDLKPRRIRIIK